MSSINLYEFKMPQLNYDVKESVRSPEHVRVIDKGSMECTLMLVVMDD